MPTLDWTGKDKVINHHKDVPYKVLERKYSFCLLYTSWWLSSTITTGFSLRIT